MARSNTGSSSNYLLAGTAAITALPVTMACWYKSASAAATSNLVALGPGGNYLALLCDGSNSYSRGAGAVIGDPSGGTTWANSETFITDTTAWHHCCAVFASATARTAYLDGIGGVVITSNVTPSTISNTSLGCYFSGTAFGPLNGSLAECAIWSAALDASEVASLAAGVCPAMVRPTSLAGYWSLIGNASPEPDLWRSRAMTINGTMSRADHPRIIYRAGARARRFKPAAAAPPTFLPAWAGAANRPVIGSGVY